jgi:flagellar basal body-associated protein FliL
MKQGKLLLVLAAVVIICLVAAQLGISVPGKKKSYEVDQWITTPEYRTDASRAIDAYERLMERYMDVVEGNLLQVGDDCRNVAIKLDSLDSRLTEISDRLTRIERALGIDPNGNTVNLKSDESGRKVKSKR